MACMQTHEVKKIRNGTEHREGERERIETRKRCTSIN